jgi:chromosome segregation ATPase
MKWRIIGQVGCKSTSVMLMSILFLSFTEASTCSSPVRDINAERKELGDLRREKESWTSQLKSAHEEAARLKQQLGLLTPQLTTLQTAKADLEQQRTREATNHAALLDSLRVEKERLEHELGSLQASVVATSTQDEEVRSLREQLRELQQQKVKADDEMTALKERTETTISRLEAEFQQKMSGSGSVPQLDFTKLPAAQESAEKIRTLEDEVARYKTILEKTAVGKSQLETALDRLQRSEEEVKRLNAAFAEMREAKSQLELALTTCQVDFDRSKALVASLQNRVGQLEEEQAALPTDRGQLGRTLALRDEEIVKLKTEVAQASENRDEWIVQGYVYLMKTQMELNKLLAFKVEPKGYCSSKKPSIDRKKMDACLAVITLAQKQQEKLVGEAVKRTPKLDKLLQDGKGGGWATS